MLNWKQTLKRCSFTTEFKQKPSQQQKRPLKIKIWTNVPILRFFLTRILYCSQCTLEINELTVVFVLFFFAFFFSRLRLNLTSGNYKSSFGKPHRKLYPRACCMSHVQHDCLSFDQSMNIIFRCRCCWLPLSFPKILHYLPTTAKYCHWKDLLLAKIRVRFVLSFRQLFLDYANSHLSSLTNSLPTNDTYHHVVWIQQGKGKCTVVYPFEMLFVIFRRLVCHPATTWRSEKKRLAEFRPVSDNFFTKPQLKAANIIGE